MNADQLFEYASRKARKAELAGYGTRYPTVRECAKRFKVRQESVQAVCEDWDHRKGYLGIAVGFGIQGVGGAYFDCLGDCLVEAYA